MPWSPSPDAFDSAKAWHPVASLADTPMRHVCHAELLGQELAVWRADDGYVNVWDNRCLHRGVRLSIGINDGHELRCQYHAWRYANRTGGCTYVPAHPGEAPGPALCARVFPSQERYGLVWTTLGDTGGVPVLDVLAGESFPLRGVPVDASAEVVALALTDHTFQPVGALDDAGAEVAVTAYGSLTVGITAAAGSASTAAVFFVQPVDDAHCVVRGVLAASPAHDERLAVLKHHDGRLAVLRERVEAGRAGSVPWAVIPAQVAPVRPPTAEPNGRRPEVQVVVRRKWATAEGVAAFELASTDGPLPTVQPGAHIDVHLPGGLVRQYSLVNGPGEQDVYRIGVKREEPSTGGSVALHDSVHEGDTLAVSRPHSNFVLRRDAARTVLVAGGIGVTPLLAMAQALAVSGPAFELHVFARSAAHVAFPEILERLGQAVTLHLDRSPDQTVTDVERLLGPYTPNSQVYVCGPAPMLQAARDVAARLGWPDATVHYEYFKNTRTIDESTSFEVRLERSGLTLSVPAGRSILEVVRDAGVNVASSCEQGACGSCVVTVLDGVPQHQDVYLRDSEHAAGDCMTICVSRAASPRLVLDL